MQGALSCGVFHLFVEFNNSSNTPGHPTDRAWNKIRHKLEDIPKLLPNRFLGPSLTSELINNPIHNVAFYSKRLTKELFFFVDDLVRCIEKFCITQLLSGLANLHSPIDNVLVQ